MNEVDELSHDAITADFRIWQRKRGHRYSLDDMMTAWQAVTECQHDNVENYLDLGCGIGSVLLMVSWRFRQANVMGIEAQEISFALARKNIDYNNLSNRVTLFHGDLRQIGPTLMPKTFDLITGTPPYLPLGTALPSPDSQRTAARIELRGGVEDYLTTAKLLLAEKGKVVICADARKPERVLSTAEKIGLSATLRRDIVPRQGANPLFTVWTLCHQTGEQSHQTTVHVARDEQGQRTNEANAIRSLFFTDERGNDDQ